MQSWCSLLGFNRDWLPCSKALASEDAVLHFLASSVSLLANMISCSSRQWSASLGCPQSQWCGPGRTDAGRSSKGLPKCPQPPQQPATTRPFVTKECVGNTVDLKFERAARIDITMHDIFYQIHDKCRFKGKVKTLTRQQKTGKKTYPRWTHRFLNVVSPCGHIIRICRAHVAHIQTSPFPISLPCA